MAEPAHSAASPGPESDPERKPDPRASGWGDVRSALITDSHAVALAVAEMACRPGDGAALEMARLCLSVLESLGVIADRCRADEAVIEAERARAFDEGVEWCKTQRCRLEVVDGGRQD